MSLPEWIAVGFFVAIAGLGVAAVFQANRNRKETRDGGGDSGFIGGSDSSIHDDCSGADSGDCGGDAGGGDGGGGD